MAYPGNLSTISYSGTDLSPYVSSISDNIERSIKDFAPVGSNPIEKIPQAYSGTISLEGSFHEIADAVLGPALLATTPTAGTTVYRPIGASGGGITYTGDAYVASYRVDTPGDDIATFRCELAFAGTITRT